ncbi:Lupus La protein [Heterostelium album PN500]|uniref:Lupus La protein n=1 Tax=Heterostelium pallidum (strain ATCC 26659 / Pp 5 / PN500) TaxID=670386 RepID=D3BHF0_HETP5|nr:Lupus La protein [Heterostelium album PN500]EFA79127.1 Lupus La protein [Heterostelium album PN500]|eukprot:XP_020431249.1 Lupus La protein [Heterostelium album PN500]
MSTETPVTPAVDTALLNKVAKQIEYYFSDSNYPTDKFLKEAAAKNPEGYVGIEVLATFNKIKSMTTDLQLISDALKDSDSLQLSEDGKMVKRLNPLPDNEELAKKTLYSKGWPKDTTTMETIQDFFGSYGKVLSVRMRKNNKDKSFKGSALVDLESEEIVNKIIADAPKFGEVELIYQTFLQFDKEKKDQEAHYLSLKKTNKNKRKSESSGDKTDAQEGDEEETTETKKEEVAVELTPGTILSIKSIGTGLMREDLKATFSQYGEVEYVDFNNSNDFGSIRYKTAESAKRALEAMTTEKKELGGKLPELSILEGEEEQKEFEKIKEKKQAKSARGGRGGRGGRGRGGRGGRGRGGFKSNKKQKN